MDCVPLWTGRNWHMDYRIRRIAQCECALLEDFPYEAISIPEGFEGEIPRGIIYDDPKCRAAFEELGALPGDRALVAEVDGEIIGACWVRTTTGYGHIDSNTPSLSTRKPTVAPALSAPLKACLESASHSKSVTIYSRGEQRRATTMITSAATATSAMAVTGVASPVSAIRRAT